MKASTVIIWGVVIGGVYLFTRKPKAAKQQAPAAAPAQSRVGGGGGGMGAPAPEAPAPAKAVAAQQPPVPNPVSVPAGNPAVVQFYTPPPRPMNPATTTNPPRTYTAATEIKLNTVPTKNTATA